MRSRRVAFAAGLGAYMLVVAAFYAADRVAFPDGRSGPYPLWYSGGEVLLTAVKAVIPGFLAGWLHGARGLSSGALIGAVGAVLEIAVFAALVSGAMLFEPLERLALAALWAVLGSGLTNALGGGAGEALSGARGRA